MRTFANRWHHRIITGAVCLLAAVLMTNSGVSASDSSAKVRVFASAGRINEAGKQTITITLMIDKGWHIYANPTRNEQYEGNRTEVKLRAVARSPKYDVEYPAGTFYTGKYNLKCMVYQGSVNIIAVVQRSMGDASPLEIDITFSACDDDVCLPPATLRGRPGDVFRSVR